MTQLISRFGKNISYENVLREYPRPMLKRDSYFSLNGMWKYEINKEREHAECADDIIVPFSPETYLSKVQKMLRPDEYLHYRKVFRFPEGFVKDRVILHFGAVDQECEVKVNGKIAGSHKGGYLPFQFDITGSLTDGDNVLEVLVTDKTEQSPHARGKQRLRNKGICSFIFYTPQSGIWKSVWLESVSEHYIKGIKVTPDYDSSKVKIRVETNTDGTAGKAQVVISFNGREIKKTEVMTGTEAEILLDHFNPWSPEKPDLYDAQISLLKTGNADTVTTSFGMRKVDHHKDADGIERFYLNNKPYFFNGVLNQGYWPESLMTEPSDEAIKSEILKLKKLGFNTIRCHVKIESERFYYYCDRYGMAVWQDMPNGGSDYDMLFQAGLPNKLPQFQRILKDHNYRRFGRTDSEGRRQYYEDLQGMIKLLYNHPSIVMWTPFNEGWGQFDASKATEKIRKNDTTRIINEACGWFDQNGGDVYSIHNYHPGLKVKPQGSRVIALTEFGGYARAVEGHCFSQKHKGYEMYQSENDLTDHYVRLMKEEVCGNIKNGLCAAIYTQTSDIENEVNGLFTYDREILKMDEGRVIESNEELYKEFHARVVNRTCGKV